MASLVLGAVGNLVGGPIGGLVGAIVGHFVDRRLFPGPEAPAQEGPRLSSLYVTSSTEGEPIPRVIGRARVSPQLIWATRFREVATTTPPEGGKGGGGGGGGGATTYTYFVSFALGLCEGEIVDIGQVWADGKLLDLSPYTWRLYKGSETQAPDPKIAAVEGPANAPAYRGLAYMVFEELPLEKFGNRIPQFSIEIFRRPAATGVRIEDALTGVSLLPAYGEFIYATDSIFRLDGFGGSIAENRHTASNQPDIVRTLDQLDAYAPNVGTVALIVGWFGTDLRCGSCEIRPKVEIASKATRPWVWQVSGLTRAFAPVVSQDAGGPLLGGTPADRSIVQAIAELKRRGYRVLMHPFIMLDTASGNSLPNPYSDHAAASGQPVFPWRGRITCSPAPGYAGTVDKSATAATQVNAFFGTAAPGDFGAWNGSTIPYLGPAEWSYRRFVLHCAKLAVAAGGVDAFLIGSELHALTTVRSAAGTFPAVSKLMTLAADVKGIVGSPCRVGYGADWTEYCNYRPADGSNDVYFHLDPLWADSHVDFVGIDYYMPLSDWRGGRLHLDAQAGASSIYEQDYLQGNIEGGELYDWFYASDADRTDQMRTAITDGGYGKPWLFRYKDIRSWWANMHYDRPLGVESGAPTAWLPQGKPIWFTELGCPAVDKGTNRPNVFFDSKSSESFFPYFSSGVRDDLIQRSFHEALLDYWAPANGRNPLSPVYGGRMLDTTNFYSWTWDARPYPEFPLNSNVWRDAPNWRRGHWLTGRLGQVTLADTVAEICAGLGVEVDVSALNGVVRGYTIDRVMSPRSALAQLMQVYFFDAVESSGIVKFVHRGGAARATFTADQLVDAAGAASQMGNYSLTRAQETELPRTAHLQFTDPEQSYQRADVYARRLRGGSDKTVEIAPALVLDFAEAQGKVDALLVDAWVMRERGTLTLPPSAYALEPTDVIYLEVNGRSFEMRLDEVGYRHTRPARVSRTDAATYGLSDGPSPSRPVPAPVQPGPAVLQIMDLPMLTDSEIAGVPRLAAYAQPWVRVSVYRSPTGSGYLLDQVIVNRSVIGQTTQAFRSGVTAVWDDANALTVQLPPASASLSSMQEILVLNGGNVAAIENADGEWEIIQFVNAELVATDSYRLTRLLRGQFGTEGAMRDPVAAGAAFVLLDPTVRQSTVPLAMRGNALNWKSGPSTLPIDDATYQTESFTFRGIGLRPYSPVHPALHWDSGGGDVVLSWIRRTRLPAGDAWEAPDVPLGEDVEAYEIDIHDGPAVVRTLTASSPGVTYTAAQQSADFGAPLGAGDGLTVAVYQMSLAFGRGAPGRATLPVAA